MGITDVFRRKSSAPPAAEIAAEPEAAAAADPRVRAVLAVLEDARERAAAASTALDAAKASENAAETARAKAEEIAEERGDDASIHALLTRQTALQFAARARERAATKAGEAHAAVTVAESALADARAEVELAARVAALRAKANLGTYTRRVAALASDAMKAEANLRAALDGIEREYAENVAASRELAELGCDDAPPLAPIHRVGALVLLHAETNPNVLGAANHRCERLYTLLHHVNTGLAEHVLDRCGTNIFRGCPDAPVPPERVGEFRGAFEALLSVRTAREGEQAIRDYYFRLGDDVEVSRRRNAREPPPEGCEMPEPEPGKEPKRRQYPRVLNSRDDY